MLAELPWFGVQFQFDIAKFHGNTVFQFLTSDDFNLTGFPT